MLYQLKEGAPYQSHKKQQITRDKESLSSERDTTPRLKVARTSAPTVDNEAGNVRLLFGETHTHQTMTTTLTPQPITLTTTMEMTDAVVKEVTLKSLQVRDTLMLQPVVTSYFG